MRTNEPHVLGAVQIKDGLFIGDAYAAQVGHSHWFRDIYNAR